MRTYHVRLLPSVFDVLTGQDVGEAIVGSFVHESLFHLFSETFFLQELHIRRDLRREHLLVARVFTRCSQLTRLELVVLLTQRTIDQLIRVHVYDEVGLGLREVQKQLVRRAGEESIILVKQVEFTQAEHGYEEALAVENL